MSVLAALADYQKLNAGIVRNEEAAIIDRWKFGSWLLAEREANGGKQLPKGRLAEIAQACGIHRRECQWRMVLAERFTEDEVRTEFALRGSWTAMRASFQSGKSSQGGEVVPFRDRAERAREVAKQHEANGAELARRRQEYDDDVDRHGPNPFTSRPKSAEAEQLEVALRQMAAGADKVRKVIELEPFLSFQAIVNEIPPANLRRDLRKVRAAYDALALALATMDPTSPPEPSDLIAMNVTDGFEDIDGQLALEG